MARRAVAAPCRVAWSGNGAATTGRMRRAGAIALQVEALLLPAPPCRMPPRASHACLLQRPTAPSSHNNNTGGMPPKQGALVVNGDRTMLQVRCPPHDRRVVQSRPASIPPHCSCHTLPDQRVLHVGWRGVHPLLPSGCTHHLLAGGGGLGLADALGQGGGAGLDGALQAVETRACKQAGEQAGSTQSPACTSKVRRDSLRLSGAALHPHAPRKASQSNAPALAFRSGRPADCASAAAAWLVRRAFFLHTLPASLPCMAGDSSWQGADVSCAPPAA